MENTMKMRITFIAACAGTFALAQTELLPAGQGDNIGAMGADRMAAAVEQPDFQARISPTFGMPPARAKKIMKRDSTGVGKSIKKIRRCDYAVDVKPYRKCE
jgi:hypothetical protein